MSCFRGLAANVAASIRKGDPVIVSGKLRTSVWEKDGQTQERLTLEADAIGHDLNRGTAMFRRTPRVASEPNDAEAPEDEVGLAGPNAEERAAQDAEAA